MVHRIAASGRPPFSARAPIQAVALPGIFLVRLPKFQLERTPGQAFPAEAILATFHILYVRLTKILRNRRQEGTAVQILSLVAQESAAMFQQRRRNCNSSVMPNSVASFNSSTVFGFTYPLRRGRVRDRIRAIPTSVNRRRYLRARAPRRIFIDPDNAGFPAEATHSPAAPAPLAQVSAAISSVGESLHQFTKADSGHAIRHWP